jgi:hypothetical protein
MMGEYWNMYGVGDAWVNCFGDQVDPTTFPDEDSLRAAGWYHASQHGLTRYGARSAVTWIERELGDVEYRHTATVYAGPLMPALVIPVESLGRDQ